MNLGFIRICTRVTKMAVSQSFYERRLHKKAIIGYPSLTERSRRGEASLRAMVSKGPYAQWVLWSRGSGPAAGGENVQVLAARWRLQSNLMVSVNHVRTIFIR